MLFRSTAGNHAFSPGIGAFSACSEPSVESASVAGRLAATLPAADSSLILSRMFIDSHCHLDFPELAGRLPEVFTRMRDNQVTHALCVSVNMSDFPNVLALAEAHEHLYA